MRNKEHHLDIFVYGDESGVLDKVHNDTFAFGGVIFLSKADKDLANRKFLHAEKSIAGHYTYGNGKCPELKASTLSKKHRTSLFRSTNGLFRYAFVIRQPLVLDSIFSNKKSKQRYLDYVYKIGLKRCFENMISQGSIDPDKVGSIRVFFDEHATATDGRYELREAVLQEYKFGTYNYNYSRDFPPVFPKMTGGVELAFRDSRKVALIRASDIIANQAWYHAENGRLSELKEKLALVMFP